MKEITKRLGAVGATRLPGWVPPGPHCALLETLQDMPADRRQWRSCQFLSRLPDCEMGVTLSDEELVHMSTSELRSLLLRRQVTAEEHKQLRNRRRRLQNRKYARKCALKKLTEVENLASEVKEESAELQALRHQLNRLSIVTRRIQHQEATLANFRRKLESDLCGRSASVSTPVRMLLSDGTEAGVAHPARLTPDVSSLSQMLHPSPKAVSCAPLSKPDQRSDHKPLVIRQPLIHSMPNPITTSRPPAVSQHNSMPLQLAAGPGMPSSTSPFYSAWPPADTSPRLPIHLVRPVGCGFAANGRNMPEF
ncbi:hypothetical protein CLF_112303 [Clonorchis sinensis]|uniref:BZIP domain-containing protein n=2 Tax=Clonorchis sinensis TaxID=79923 RepID=G7YW56_CLOSI|nr:hypothetical protein CLF_112303 [Clonorchis sinensis]